MDIVRVVIIILHPIAALVLIWIFFSQRKWRELSSDLKGNERREAQHHHEIMGDRILIASLSVVLIAFVSNVIRGVLDNGEPTRYLIPSFHGTTGLIGLFLMYYLWKLGRKTKHLKETKHDFTSMREAHGKVSDLLGILVAIHAFLGFLYLLNIL